MFLINLTNIENEIITNLVNQRASAPVIQPELVNVEHVKGPNHYNRLKDTIKKDQYRQNLLNGLRTEWISLFGELKALALEEKFKQLLQSFDEMGALVFGGLISKNDFVELIRQFDLLLKKNGSNSWIHSYVNLAFHPQFLSFSNFNTAFLHPLLIALISFRVGGPIRIVGARLKDAKPISVMAQDNMLHIDNSPFADEYKIILAWEKNKPSGPKGQNFVFIPGTHKGLRNSFQRLEDGSTWSTENASIFNRNESLEKMFDFQEKMMPGLSPMVVEACHCEKPLTVAFAAGSLVHHRYRTEDGSPRSCIILAFRRAADNVGQFISDELLEQISLEYGSLIRFLLGKHKEESESLFIRAVTNEALTIYCLLNKLINCSEDTIIIDPLKIKLTRKSFEKWKSIVTNAPTVEQLKSEKLVFPLGKIISREEMFDLIIDMMTFDKHGHMDLILYNDNHEEIRKWVRNQIREMNTFTLQERLKDWKNEIEQPMLHHLITPFELKVMANELADRALREMIQIENISFYDAFRSVRQNFIDLGETVVRCESKQAFLSTCLFMFWTCDFLIRMQKSNCQKIKSIGNGLLMNYITTYILFDMHKLNKV